MAEIIFGIDHGNGNMKGENVCFPCGLVRYVSEPGRFMNEIFWSIREHIIPCQIQKCRLKLIRQ